MMLTNYTTLRLQDAFAIYVLFAKAIGAMTCSLFAWLISHQPPASSTFLSQQTSHQQPANSTFFSEQTSTSHQPPAKRTG
jgi:hypothetical protein